MHKYLPIFSLVIGFYALSMSVVNTIIFPNQAFAAFPGVNGKIVFETERDDNWEVYVMNADGSGQTNLTNNPAFDAEPSWSPDGTKIAFTSSRDDASEVYVMN